MKTLVTLLAAAGLGVAALSASPPRMAANVNQPSLIDGGRNPESIPDRVAYSLMLRFVSSPRGEEEKRYLDAYIAQIGFENESDANVLLSAADEYGRRVGEVDSKVNVIKEQEGRGTGGRRAVQDRLSELWAINDSITDDAINSLSSRLSGDGLAKLRRFIDGRVKRNVKLQPDSPTAR